MCDNRWSIVALAVLVGACGVSEGTLGEGNGATGVGQAGKTPQGKTPQGKTPQGKTPQGQAVGIQQIDKFGSTWPAGMPFGTTNLARYDDIQLVGSTLRVRVPILVYTMGGSSSGVQPTAMVDAPVGTVLSTVAIGQNTIPHNVPVRIVGKKTENSGAAGTPNLTQGRVTGSLSLYSLQVSQGDGTWKPMCDTDEGNWGLFTAGYWSNSDVFDNFVAQPQTTDRYLGFSCLDGTSAKCIRWGYQPWHSQAAPATGAYMSLMPLYMACTHAAMADYCGTLDDHTIDGTIIDIWDIYGFITKTAENGDAVGFSNESSWEPDGALCVEAARWASIGTTCTEQVVIQPPVYCGINDPGCIGHPKPIVMNANATFQNGQRQACVTQQASFGHPSIVYVDSSTYCRNLHSVGPSPRKDCNSCTASVCTSLPACCTGTWSQACVDRATHDCFGPIVLPPIGGSVIR